jgi:hypothetical protein
MEADAGVFCPTRVERAGLARWRQVVRQLGSAGGRAAECAARRRPQDLIEGVNYRGQRPAFVP